MIFDSEPCTVWKLTFKSFGGLNLCILILS